MRVHYGSGNVPAHVALGSGKELLVGGREPAQLRLESPVFVFAGDHMTLRDWSGQQTLAGAIVLDPDAPRRAFRSRERQMWLARVARSLDDPAQFVAAHVARDTVVRPSSDFAKTRFGQQEIDAAAAQLIHGTAVTAENVLADANTWTRAVQRVAELVDEAHHAYPEHAGLALTDLRNTLKKEFPFEGLFDALIASACERGYLALRLDHPACRAPGAASRTAARRGPCVAAGARHSTARSSRAEAARPGPAVATGAEIPDRKR